jgi:(R,R)-butanediol dehydrogenase/meso-butanediol dehydrogenase/diacetyl reductase
MRVAWCGLCGSDVTEYVEGPVVIPRDPHPLTHRVAPIVLGHEISGTIVLADGEPSVEGQRAVTDTLISCGHCPACARGEPNLCPLLAVAGLSADGGLAEFVDVPADSCVAIPEDLELDVAALAEPLAVAVRAVARARIAPGDKIVVVGLGAVGLLVALLLSAHGVSAVDPTDARRVPLNAEPGVQTLSSLDEVERTADERWVAFECTGNEAALNGLIAWSPPHTRIVLVGVHGHRTPTDLHRFLHSELELVATLSHDRQDMREAVATLAASPERFAPLLSHRVAIEDAPAVLESMTQRGGTVVKALIGPEGARWQAAQMTT